MGRARCSRLSGRGVLYGPGLGMGRVVAKKKRTHWSCQGLWPALVGGSLRHSRLRGYSATAVSKHRPASRVGHTQTLSRSWNDATHGSSSIRNVKSEAKRGEGLGANRLGGLLRPRVRHGADYGKGTDTLELPRTVAGIERGLAATQ